MGDPQDPMGAFQEFYQVLIWRSPPQMRATVRSTLSQCAPAQGVPSTRLAVIEGMMYGCRVAEVLTICLTAVTLDDLCRAFMEERDHVTEMYGEERRIERLRLEQAVAAGQPHPPRPPPLPPLPAQWPPQGQPAQWQPPPEQWPPSPGMAWPSQPPAGHRRAHFTPGPGAAESPPLLARPPGGKQRRATPCHLRQASGPFRRRPELLGARLCLLRGSCPVRRRTRCTRSGGA